MKASEAGTLGLEDFRGLPEDDAFRVELSRGRLVREPDAGGVVPGFRIEVAELYRR